MKDSEVRKAVRLYKSGLIDYEALLDRIGSLTFTMEAPYKGPYVSADDLYKYREYFEPTYTLPIGGSEASYPSDWDEE